MKTASITITTGNRRGLYDLTRECANFVNGEGDGLLNVFVPHATAGVVIMELGAGSDDDLMQQLDELLPRDDRWRGIRRRKQPNETVTVYCRKPQF